MRQEWLCYHQTTISPADNFRQDFMEYSRQAYGPYAYLTKCMILEYFTWKLDEGIFLQSVVRKKN